MRDFVCSVNILEPFGGNLWKKQLKIGYKNVYVYKLTENNRHPASI